MSKNKSIILTIILTVVVDRLMQLNPRYSLLTIFYWLLFGYSFDEQGNRIRNSEVRIACGIHNHRV